MSCLDEEREIVREDAAMGLDWDRKRKLLEVGCCRCCYVKGGDGNIPATRELHINHELHINQTTVQNSTEQNQK
jgi:hypothetical protein